MAKRRSVRGRVLREWLDHAACAARPDLPWITEADQVDDTDREQMAAVCAACPVLATCRVAVEVLTPTAAFWAGAHRDPQLDTETDGESEGDTAPLVTPPPGVAVEWVPHQSNRTERHTAPADGTCGEWEQAALVWPTVEGAA